ncbi:hypothetical protein EBU60_05290 [bacterium]|nr:hypothetical protein [bacterium]
MIPDHLVRDYCDCCGTQSHKRQIVAVMKEALSGVMLMTVCRQCGPDAVEAAAEADKSRWLSGGTIGARSLATN